MTLCHRSTVRDVTYHISVPATASTDLTALGGGVGLGVAQRCRDMRDKVVEVTGTYTGSIAVQVKVANAWVPLSPSVSGGGTPTLVPIDVSAEWLRIDVTAMSGGPAPTCVLRGLDTRSDG